MSRCRCTRSRRRGTAASSRSTPRCSGPPSAVTAYGGFRGIKACAQHRYGGDSVAGKTVALQGCGSVGYHLARLLHVEGAKLVVTDIDPARVKRVVNECGAAAVGTEEIYD